MCDAGRNGTSRQKEDPQTGSGDRSAGGAVAGAGGRLLFKLVVEHNMTNHLLGGDVDMTRDEYSKMRGSSVREVASTHGNISFKDVLLFHQEE